MSLLRPGSRTSPFTPLAVVVVLALLGTAVRRSVSSQPPGGGAEARAAGCLEPDDWDSCDDVPTTNELVGAREPVAEATLPPVSVLEADRVCRNAGYLCEGLERRGNLRVLRWSDDTGEILVHVPEPPGESAGLARQLQSAAARGIRAWDGRPFRIRIDERGSRGRPDIVVQWSRGLGGAELGHARTQWVRTARGATIEVLDFALATQSPLRPGRALSPRQVELTAAHEMGHALGLPHSDSERDVMYPTNTATALTAQDYRTMQALYGLENGAEIRRR